MLELTGKQRKFLRGQAHALRPVVRIGKHGLTDAVRQQTLDAFVSHELIKIKMEAEREERGDLAAGLAAACDAAVAGVIGGVAILYRPHVDAEKRAIQLPD